MRDQREPFLENAVTGSLEESFRLSTRIAVIESNYASREYVAEVRWQVVKWLFGVGLGGIAVGAGIVTLLVQLLSK